MFTPIPADTPNWDVPLNAALTTQDSNLTNHQSVTPDPHGDRVYADTHLLGATVTGSVGVGKALAATSATAAGWVNTMGTGDWVFNVRAYGAKGDGKVVTDGAITSGTATLTCGTSQPFTMADIGKVIMVKGAAASGVTSLVTTIIAFTNANTVTLATNAAVTVASGGQVMWATDDTASIQSAINAAFAYAVANSGEAVVFLPACPGYYGVGGGLITGGSTLGNAQLTIPLQSTALKKINLTIQGPTNGAAVQHWLQTVPQTSGAIVSFGVFSSTSAQTASINAGGNPCVIGGPAQPGGYGISPGIYTNVMITLRDMAILTTHSSFGITYTAFDFSGMANAAIENMAFGTTGSVLANDYAAPANFANGLSIGGLFPANGNNDNCYVRNVVCHGGYTYAFFATEHSTISRMVLLYCWSALCVVGIYNGSVGATHAIYADQISIEACTNNLYFIGAGSGGIGPFIDIIQMDTETSTPTFADNNSGVALADSLGTVKLTGLYTASSISVGAVACGLSIIDGQNPLGRRSVSATATQRLTDRYIFGNTTAGGFTVTLLTAVSNNNTIEFRNTGSANSLTIAAAGAQTINGSATLVLTTGQTAKLVSNGSNWFSV